MTDIIYYDRDICVCVKPRGVLSEGEGQSCLPLLLEKALSEKGVKTRVYPVHRLDRETEGLMVYGLSAQGAAELSRQIRERELKKEYTARICGVPDPCEGELRDLLFYDRKRGRSFVVDRERKGVKEAILTYKLMDTDGKYSRVRVALKTGRTHQIRVQFASRGMPLCGDRRYGAVAESGEFSLTSCYLSFFHPTKKEKMEFSI